MKLFITLISLITVLAWAGEEEVVNQNDPSMQVGLNSNATEGDFNDVTKAHQLAQKSLGQNTTANCPYCAKQNAVHEQPDDGVLTDSTGTPVKDGSGSNVRTTQ